MRDGLIEQLLKQAQVAFRCKTIPTPRRYQEIDCPYSAVTRIELACDGLQKVVYLKRVKTDRISDDVARKRVSLEYQTLVQLSEHFLSHPTLGIVRPIAVFPEVHALVTEEVPGVQLMDMIGRFAKRYLFGQKLNILEKYCGLAGIWLREFQAFTSRGTAEFNIHGLESYCSERLDTLIADRRSGIDETFKAKFLVYLQEKHKALSGRIDAIVGRHNDFSPHNIIVDGDVVSVIDFGFFDHDSYLYDICKFWFQLECMKISPLFSTTAIDRLQKSFLEGYGDSVDPSDPAFEVVASRYFVTRLVTMSKEGVRGGPRGWVDRRSYRWCLSWLSERCERG
jgi:tRNA A-37 threonylcarbamoyl transferase component Bud32